MRTPTDIIRDVAFRFGVEASLVCGSSELPTALRARRCITYVLRVERGCTWGEVAKALGCERSAVRKLHHRHLRSPDPRLSEFLGGDA